MLLVSLFVYIVPEAEYSASLSKTFLMVNVEESYKPDGWLAILQAKSSSLSIYEDDQVERSFADLKKLLGDRSRNKESLAKVEGYWRFLLFLFYFKSIY